MNFFYNMYVYISLNIYSYTENNLKYLSGILYRREIKQKKVGPRRLVGCREKFVDCTCQAKGQHKPHATTAKKN